MSEDSILESFGSRSNWKKKWSGLKKRESGKSADNGKNVEQGYLARMEQLEKEKADLVREMMVQCKLNECRFSSLVQKKKKEKEIRQEIDNMNQEFLLMKKQVEMKEKLATEMKNKATQVQKMNEVKEKWRKAKLSYKQKMENLQSEQVKEGKRNRDESRTNKLKRIAEIFKDNKKSYRIVKQKSKEASSMRTTEMSGLINDRIAKARENKIKLTEGSLMKKSFIRAKLVDLDHQISGKIENHDNGFRNMQKEVRSIVTAQKSLKKELYAINNKVKNEAENLAKITRLSHEQTRQLRKPIINYNFSGFEDKAQKLKYLFNEGEAARKETKESEMITRRSVEDSVNRMQFRQLSMSSQKARYQNETLETEFP